MRSICPRQNINHGFMINQELIDGLIDRARQTPRLRMNHNIHLSAEAPSQRLVNVLLPGTPVPVHRHRHTSETYILLQGRMYVDFYDDGGKRTARMLLDRDCGNLGVNIPAGQWHGIEVLEPTAIFEAKDGPYKPLEADDILQIND